MKPMMRSMSIIIIGALVALLGATPGSAVFGKGKQPTQMVTNYVPINQAPPVPYGAELVYYPPVHYSGQHMAHQHGAGYLGHYASQQHGGHHVGQPQHQQQHGGSGGSAAAASAAAGGAASASASAANAPPAPQYQPMYHEPQHQQQHQHHMEHNYSPAGYYPESHPGHAGGLVQNYGLPAPKKHGRMKSVFRRKHNAGAHGAHGAHMQADFGTQYY